MSSQGNLCASYAHRNYSHLLSLATDQPLALNKWQYVGTSYDHNFGIASIWLNGERVVQQSIGAAITLATQDNVRMGAKDGNPRYLLGRIAAIQVFDAALTARQILEVKNNGLGRNFTSLSAFLTRRLRANLVPNSLDVLSLSSLSIINPMLLQNVS